MIWPSIVLISLLFFKKVFTYFFFSLEEFNFFGTKGKLKNVEVMIREKADDLWKKEKDESALEKEREDGKRELEALKKSNIRETDRSERIITFAEKAMTTAEKYQKENFELERKLASYKRLVAQGSINRPQPKTLSELYEASIAVEEREDVGTTNIDEELSESKKD